MDSERKAQLPEPQVKVSSDWLGSEELPDFAKTDRQLMEKVFGIVKELQQKVELLQAQIKFQAIKQPESTSSHEVTGPCS